MPVQFGSIGNISREAKLKSLIPSANLTLMSEVTGASVHTDGVTNIASVPNGTNKIPSREAEALCSAKYLSREAGSEALCSAKYLHNKARSGAPLHAKSEVTMTSLQNLSVLSSRLVAELDV